MSEDCNIDGDGYSQASIEKMIGTDLRRVDAPFKLRMDVYILYICPAGLSSLRFGSRYVCTALPTFTTYPHAEMRRLDLCLV